MRFFVAGLSHATSGLQSSLGSLFLTLHSGAWFRMCEDSGEALKHCRAALALQQLVLQAARA